ncbi:MAG: hypothetical protein H0W73_03225 [Bacteroidetes bacterium]|nr:hypothetical protein [Bacteroidota bacterium]
MKAIVCLFFLVAGLSSCRKNYVCECKNSNATYPAGEIEATRSKAKKYCQDLSTADTKCNIQQ